MRMIGGAEFRTFTQGNRIAVVHFDAEWDVGHRPRARRAVLDAERVFGDRVGFAEVDVDRDRELAELVGLLNVPAIAYFRDGRLVATLIGADQDVVACIERVVRGEPVDDHTLAPRCSDNSGRSTPGRMAGAVRRLFRRGGWGR